MADGVGEIGLGLISRWSRPVRLIGAAILPRRSLAYAVGGVLTAIYGILYTILRAEDYALLGGTVLLVVALGVTMFFTRSMNREDG
jgi:inner membrane protein involved in colicin E2 resistance